MQPFIEMPPLVEKLSLLLEARAMRITTAESCTGGMIAEAITARPGSSAMFEYGFVTYSNAAKTDLLGVRPEILAQYGAVSAQTAEAMAIGARARASADIALSVTGIAGPSGATPSKPVGLVFIGVALRDAAAESFEHRFSGDRDMIRRASAQSAIEHAIAALERNP